MKWTKDGARVPIKSWCDPVENGAMKQAQNLAALSVTFKQVALMPDCHVGYGMPIGGVIACQDAVIPNAVGVDIGCGMLAAQTNMPCGDMDRRLVENIVHAVRARIPLGFEHHREPQPWGGWDRAPLDSSPVRAELDSARRQLGTLGGGNHFLEVQAGDDGLIWLMIHSGSRNFGLKIAEHYHRMALRICDDHKESLPDKDLAWLPRDTVKAQEYLGAMNFALAFARENRARMMEVFSEIVRGYTQCRIEQTIDIHHNYCAEEKHFGRDVLVHRKGATSAVKGQTGIIPGSMGAPSYIVRGLGNPESFMSCSHGAGRRMGRNEACRTLSVEECNKAMTGIVHGQWSRDRKGHLDVSEAPQAYKDIEQVMAAQSDLVEILVKLRPLGVVKG